MNKKTSTPHCDSVNYYMYMLQVKIEFKLNFLT